MRTEIPSWTKYTLDFTIFYKNAIISMWTIYLN